jgi:hypothetical protein
MKRGTFCALTLRFSTKRTSLSPPPQLVKTIPKVLHLTELLSNVGVSLGHILDHDRLIVCPRFCLTYHLAVYHMRKVRPGDGVSYLDMFWIYITYTRHTYVTFI